jgi:hypothetical protein
MNNFNIYNFRNLGYISEYVPQKIRGTILKEIEDIQNDKNLKVDFRSKLIGNISEEYQLISSLPVLSDFVISSCNNYIDTYGYFGDLDYFNNDLNLTIKDLWVNFQRKGDFNPIHNHRGLFSFVIWINIPYNLQEELNLYKNSADPVTSVFAFHYINAIGDMEVQNLLVDKTWEWKMIVFPSKIYHSVNPFFTSDGVRISVAGNVFIDI